METRAGGADVALTLRPGSRGTISGRVVDPDGAPVADVEVIAKGLSEGKARSDDDGRFEIHNLLAGDYEVKPEYESGSAMARAPAEDVVVVRRPRPERPEGGVRFRLLLPEGTAPPAEVHVAWTTAEGSWTADVRGDDGDFTWSGLDAGQGTLAVEAGARLAETRVACEIVADKVADLGLLEVGPGRSARVRVVDREGRPVAGARVCIDEGASACRAGVETDAEGGAVVEHVPAGPLAVWVTGDGFAEVEATLPEAGEEARIVLSRLGHVRGRVRGPGGRPLAAEVQFVQADVPEEDAWNRWISNAAGRAYDAELPAGRYRVRLVSVGGAWREDAPVEAEVDLPEGGEVTLDLYCGVM